MYTTIIRASKDGELKTFSGPHVPGISVADAQQYCEDNGLGYCRILGLLIVEIPCKDNKPDINNMTEYDSWNN